MKRHFSYLTIIVLLVTFLSGCGNKSPRVVSQCPPFPAPTEKALKKIQDINDPEVDDWMMRLFKHKQQLNVSVE